MNDPHETMFNEDVARITWVTAQDLEDIEYMEFVESQLKETNDKGEDPF